MVISYDKDYYTRSAKVPVTYSDGEPSKIEITFNANWVEATYTTVSSTRTWQTAFGDLNAAGMRPIVSSQTVIDGYEPYDMTGYFLRVTLPRGTSLVGYYNNRGQLQTRGTCNTYGGCTYYQIINNQNYQEGTTYYYVRNNSMTALNPSTLPRVPITHEEYNEDIGNKNVAGYYKMQHFARNATVGANFYDANGNKVTSCTDRNGCDYYELQQYYSSGTTPNIAQASTTYYYLVTRDTNIIVMTNNMNTTWGSSQNKPFTLTTMYRTSGQNYNTGATWTVSTVSSSWLWGTSIDGVQVNAYNDTTIENIRINCSIDFSDPEDSDIEFSDIQNPTSRNGGFYGNYNNVKIGRGITQTSSNGNFITFVAGTTSGVSEARYKVMIEQGVYMSISNTNTAGASGTVYADGYIVYGNDYDRAKNDNSKLNLYYCASGSWGSAYYSLDDKENFIELTVKSGSFGTGKYDHTSGIYVGGRYNGTHNAARKATILGGYIYNLIGGPLTANDRGSVNDTYIYQKGGTIDMITGGAGTSATYGNRIIQVTGGQVNYSVFGGSNGYDGDEGDGTLRGSSLVYIGGNATIGDEDLLPDGKLWGAEAGSVFGNGNGKSGSSTIGSNDNSNVIIDDGATINNNVYGGGNFSAVGVSKTSGTTTTNIWVHGGTVKGSIYGGGNNNGSGSSSISSTVNIQMDGGTVQGAIYGGSNEQGTIYGNVNVSVVNGSVASVFGGGKGGYVADDATQPGTYVTQNVEVTIGDDDVSPGPTITGSVFGGSAYGTVNGATNTNTVSQSHTYVTVNKGTINSVFGGGKGDSTYTPYVEGPVVVTVNGGTVTNVFGGNDAAGKPNGSVNVILNGGTVTNTYGGGNQTGVTTTNVELKGATCTNIYGGSNTSGDVTRSNVILTSGTATTVYGGNNQGGVTTNAYVKMQGSPTIGTIYGGGNVATTGQTTVDLVSGTVTDVYGGGKSANVTLTTTVNQTGATCTSIYGGSNTSGTVPESTVNINGGTATSVYGGNNAGGTTGITNINLNAGKATNVYGGGNQAVTTTSNITLDGTNTRNIYGGGNQAGLTTSNIDLKSGTATNVFGGSNQSGTVTTSNIQTSATQKTTFNNQTEISLTATYTTTAANVTVDEETYQSIATVDVTVTNNSDKKITQWSGIIKANDSILYENNTNHDIAEDNGVYSFNQINNADENSPFELNAGASHTFQFKVYSKKTPANFTIDEKSVVGLTSGGDAYVQNSENLIVSNLYGGNNAGGLTSTTNINLTKGYIHNVYGGGNLAPVNNANINCNGVSIGGQLYGGGNQAAVNNNTNVDFVNSSILGSIYGGGNAGTVGGNTDVYISSSTIGESVYAGGNGAAAVVSGNTLVTIDGTTTVGKNVFGGGNAAQTGTEQVNNSISTVNIAGATIGGNVYGGANTSRVYGYTKVNVGYNTITNNSNLVKGDIHIGGTVFGGGEANASGSTNYDFSFISVTRGIDIAIDAATHTNFNIDGSIFGSGNASSTSGYSYITIDNYGNAATNDIKRNVSLQRADRVIIRNSCFELSGAKDRTNDYADELFSISRVTELKIKNGTTIYLKAGANLLEKFTSAVDVSGAEQIAAVNIDEDTKTVTKNVDNRIYILEGKVLNIAKTQNISTPGEVHGMTFFGMYQRTREGVISTGLYDKQYGYDDVVPSTDLYMYSKGSYVLGEHYRPNHDITVDGFYSNFDLKDSSGKIKVDYIHPTPDDADYYMWSIGEQVSSYPMTITASKYLTLGTVDLPLVMHSGPNAVLSIVGFNYADLAEGVNLVDPDTIPRIAPNQTAADNNMGLVIRTPSTGWMNKGETMFLSDPDNPINGTINYKRENSVMTPVLQFYLYHSKNLYTSGNMGDITISLVVVTPLSDLESKIERVNIEIHLTRALFTTNDYEGTAAPGKQYGLFASDAINITTTGSYSNYYSLFVQQQNFYQTGCYRVLVSDYVLPEKTKITLIDLHNRQDPSYYYYIVSASDYTAALAEFQTNQEVAYPFSRFIRMGSTSAGNTYSDATNNTIYYDSSTETAQEEFIAIVDFSESGINSNVTGKSLLIELRSSGGQTIVGVLGLQQAAMQYNLIHGNESVIDVAGTLSKNNIYPGDEVGLNVTTNFVQTTYGGIPVYDTVALDHQLGIKITIFDSNDNQVTGASLLGVSYELDGIHHYPRVDGTTRIKIAEKVSNVLARIKFHTTKSLAPGTYTMKIESFGSPDGIYYGLTSSDYVEVPFNILDSVYGLEVTLPEKQVIIDKTTGKNLNDNNTIVFNYKYGSVLANPEIHISLKRRKYSDELCKRRLHKFAISRNHEFCKSRLQK